ncbi:WD40-repeat-containing domain protein [Pyronema domesticum]|uniref:Similar to Probable U3 small nucleolar RNA-associated protein 13 acc. no. Q9USN3 n=1 Tax=Pyronema omphalodes (strain CBS 100304) TaxID=1076935 RepID=U4LIA8_PYROM|nr:WD40-repeat-containing domain protein [Pyronema domesticum]CCX31824.1 Similar to Probable U3 small nucleolar RNA-associated protein 13; acc. no. Q9USN3 [Pyronema omphalodes CBS 100304]
MAPSSALKTTFKATKTIKPFYSGGVGCVALDRSGRLLVTANGDEAVITDIENGAEVARIDGLEDEISTVALSPDASYLILSISKSYQMHTYSLSPDFTTVPITVTPNHERQVKQTSPIIVSACDPTGTLVATGGSDGLVKVWDIRKGFVTHNLRGHGGLVSALSFFMAEGESPVEMEATTKKGKKKDVMGRFMLATGGEDTQVLVWDLETTTNVATLQNHNSIVRGLDWSLDGKRLLSGGRDGVMCLIDTKTWNAVPTPTGEEVEAVGFVAPGMFEREDGGSTDKLIFAAGRQDRIRVWDLTKGEEITKEAKVEEDEEKGVIQVIYHKSLASLLSVHHDYTIQIHALRLPSPAPISLPTTKHITTNYDQILDLQFLPPDSSLIAIATNSENVTLVSSKTFHDVAILRGHTETVLTLDSDWSGHWLATAGKDNDARLWKIDAENNSFTCAAVFTGHAESVAALSLPRQRPQEGSKAAEEKQPPKFMLTGGADRTIKKWDVSLVPGKKPRAVWTKRAHEKDINAIDVSPDDSLFASASQDRTVKIWSTEEGETIGVLRGHRRAVWSVKFAPSTITASAVGGEAGMKGGRMVVTGSTDKTVKLWSLVDYSCLKTFEGHTNSIQRALWISGGLQVVSGGNDGLVKVWDIKSGECSATLDNHEQRIWAISTRPDEEDQGSTIASADAEGVITFWSDVTATTIAEKDAEEQALVEEQQKLANYIAINDYRSAISLALSLNHPGQLLKLLTSVTTATPEAGSLSGIVAVDEVLSTLSDSQLGVLLCRIRDWNTNARTAVTAQRVLFVLLRSYGAPRLVSLRGVGRDVWDALGSYTERHYKRIEELVEESFMVEYTLKQMEQVLGNSSDSMEIEVL